MIQDLQSRPTENVHLCKRIPSDILCLQRVWTHLLGDPETGDNTKKQQIRYSLFLN